MSTAHSYRVRVARVVHETADAHSFVLAPEAAETERFAYLPGQFLTVRVPTDRAEGAARCYSLCSSPHVGEPLKITVKRTVDGYGSNWICDHVFEGTVLEVLRPSGTFTPRSLEGDLVLFAAGSGITPVLSICKSALHAGAGRITLVYANRDERSVIFRDELQELAVRFPERFAVIHWLESVQGLPSVAALTLLARPFADRTAYVCGPAPFMDATTAALAEVGLPREHVHVERFLTLDNDPFASSELVVDQSAKVGTVQVELDGVTSTVAWPANNHLLDVLLDAGLDAPFSCREGQCSACACRLVDGRVSLDHNEVLEQQDLDEGYILACQAIPLTEHVAVSYD